MPINFVQRIQCIGEDEKYELCDDTELCILRRSREDIATRKCQYYKTEILKIQDSANIVRGLPGQHSNAFIDQGTIHILCHHFLKDLDTLLPQITTSFRIPLRPKKMKKNTT